LNDLLREAAHSLSLHWMRTLLSGLGILFGVAAVIGILSIGEGARREQEQLISRLGILNFQIRQLPLPEDEEEADQLRRVTRGLSLRDVAALREVLPEAVHIGGMRKLDGQEMVPRPTEGQDVHVVGVEPAYLAGTPVHLVAGRPLRRQDNDRGARVAILGDRARKALFGADEALGKQIRVGTVWVRVVGLLSDNTSGTVASSFGGIDIQDRSRDILLPLNTVLEHFPPAETDPELDEIQVSLREMDHVSGHTAVATAVLERLHKGQNVYDLVVPMRLLEQSRAQQRIFNLVMGLIAGISLLVGGIGIMNIMLASVMERTREIGIRMAVGASPTEIHRLFLVEASMISLAGGVLGILVGYAISWLVASFTGWATAVAPEAVGLVLLLSMGEGVVFGYVPARRASQMQPAQAVRTG
jgi:putative ABC transport system permease protein